MPNPNFRNYAALRPLPARVGMETRGTLRRPRTRRANTRYAAISAAAIKASTNVDGSPGVMDGVARREAFDATSMTGKPAADSCPIASTIHEMSMANNPCPPSPKRFVASTRNYHPEGALATEGSRPPHRFFAALRMTYMRSIPNWSFCCHTSCEMPFARHAPFATTCRPVCAPSARPPGRWFLNS
jgi:hypothetical protein